MLPGSMGLEPDIDRSVPHPGFTMTGLEHDIIEPQRKAAVNVAQMRTDNISQRDKDSLDKASRMRLQWNEAKCKNMDLPKEYQTVAVLIIKWCEELDGLNCAGEVSHGYLFVKKLFAKP